MSDGAGANEGSGNVLEFSGAARVPAAGDNVAIATRRLEAGTVLRIDGAEVRLPHTVMEGHRFVLDPIARDGHLLSWGLPFGRATRDLVPGEYVCNEKILAVLAERNIDFELPRVACFLDHLARYELDEARFEPGRQVDPVAEPATFEGFERAGSRGVGTRNFIVVLALTSQSVAFAEALAARFEGAADGRPNLDGVVAVTHTEGAGADHPNNLELVLRTLAGFVVHPNAGAVLIVDHGDGAYTADTLREYMAGAGYPLDAVTHEWLTVDEAHDVALDRASAIIEPWLAEVASCERRPMPVSELKLALQCGGSDAFSGISGNALAGWVAKAVIRNGGAANLAETDELIGAEPYVLSNVRDFDTARTFLGKIEAFKRYAANHGTSAEGNPSGGNNFRGLYNIALKSIGAARKKDPEVRLDHVIDYGQPMHEGGYYFMDSPGNDLESIAGQVASGSNVILFITGNGSITNFPFVPTLKFVTTSGRFKMLENEMDVNAGRYNDGMEMDALGEETFDLALSIASGRRSKGELAGHAQVQIWRDWPRTEASGIEDLPAATSYPGRPLATRSFEPSALTYTALVEDGVSACDNIGLVMPTSLCSGQVARLIADHVNDSGGVDGLSRCVALVHTEGCGSNNSEDLFLETLLGHLRHPSTRRAVLLEHGCERTHNDAIRHYLQREGIDLDRFGWASVQLDGGIDAVRGKVEHWLRDSLRNAPAPSEAEADASTLSLALLSGGPVPDSGARTLAAFAGSLVAAGGTVVVPESDGLVHSGAFRDALLGDGVEVGATIGYGQAAPSPGLHVMACPTRNPLEMVTGLGGTGVGVMLAHVGRAPLQGHPMIPMVLTSAMPDVTERFAGDLDVEIDGVEAGVAQERLEVRIADVASRRYRPKTSARGLTSFQLTRGVLGLSL